MSKDLKLSIMLKAVDKVTRPLRGVIKTAEKLRGQMAQTSSELKEMEAVQRAIEGHRKLQQKLGTTASKMDQLQKEVAEMGRAIAATNNPTKRQIQQFEQAQQQLDKLKTAHRQQKQALQESTTALKRKGVNTRNLSSAEKQLASNIAMVNQRLQTQAARLDAIRKKTNAATQAKENTDKALQQPANTSFVSPVGNTSGKTALPNVANVTQPGIAFEEKMSSAAALAEINTHAKAPKQPKALQRPANVSFVGAAGDTSGKTALPSVAHVIQPGISFEEKMSPAAALAEINTHAKASKQPKGQVNEILSVISGMLDLPEVGNTDLVMTADIASHLLSGFNLEAPKIGKVSDALANTFIRSNSSLELLVKTMKHLTPIAAKVGASMKKTGAMASLLGNVAIEDNAAVTVIESIAARIATPPKAALNKWPVNTTDAAGHTPTMPKITKKIGDTKQRKIYRANAGKPSGSGLTNVMAQGSGNQFTQFLDTLRTVTEKSRTMSSNTEDSIAKMTGAWDQLNTALSAANTALPSELTQPIADIIQPIDLWIQKNPKLSGQLLDIVDIVAAMPAAFDTLTGSISDIVTATETIFDTLSGTISDIVTIRDKLKALGVTSEKIRQGINQLGTGFQSLGKKIVTHLGSAFLWLGNKSLAMITGIKKLGLALWWLGKTILPFLGKTFLWLGRIFLMNPIGLVITAIAGAAYLIYRYWEPIKGYFSGLWQEVKSAFDGGIAGVAALIINWSPLGLFYNAFAGVMGWFGIELPGSFTDFGSMLISGLVDGIKNKYAAAKEAITNIGGLAVDWFKDKLGIQSPSRVFAEMGGFISQGVGQGIQQKAQYAVNAVKQLGDQLPKVLPTALAVGITANGALAADDTLLQPRQVIASPASYTPSSAPQAITIHVHAAPGMNEHAVAKLVANEIENQNRQIVARTRSRLYDGEA